MRFVNLTGHNINVAPGIIPGVPADGLIPPEKGEDGQPIKATVSAGYSDFDDHGVCFVTYGNVVGLPPASLGVIYIVSALVLAAVKEYRYDVVAPATGHPLTKRNEKGHILEVPGFVR